MKLNFLSVLKILLTFCLIVPPFLISSHPNGADLTTSFLIYIACLLPIFNCFIKDENSGTYDFFQPGTIFLLFYYVYIILPAYYNWKVLDYSSNWVSLRGNSIEIFDYSLLICIIGIISFGLGYKWITNNKLPGIHKDNNDNSDVLKFRSPQAVVFILSLFISIGLIGKYLVISSYGPVNLLEMLSPSKRASALEESGRVAGYIFLIQYFFDWGVLLLTYYSISTGKFKRTALIILLLAIALIYITVAKRSAVIPLLLLPLTWYHYRISAISMKKGIIYSTLLFLSSFLLLFVRILVPLLATGDGSNRVVVEQILSNPLIFYFDSPELSIFDMVMLAVQDGETIINENGGFFNTLIQSNIAPVLYLIPRFLWADKPTFRELGQIFYTYTIGASHDSEVGFTISIFSTLYVWGSLIGVSMGLFIIGKLIRFLYLHFRATKQPSILGLFSYSLIFWNFFQFLRFGSFGFLILLIIQTQLQGFFVLFFILKKNNFRYHFKNNAKKY